MGVVRGRQKRILPMGGSGTPTLITYRQQEAWRRGGLMLFGVK